MADLTHIIDRNYALRKAVERASVRIQNEIYSWPEEKTHRYYENLKDGRLTLDWKLEHPNDIEPSGL